MNELQCVIYRPIEWINSRFFLNYFFFAPQIWKSEGEIFWNKARSNERRTATVLAVLQWNGLHYQPFSRASTANKYWYKQCGVGDINTEHSQLIAGRHKQHKCHQQFRFPRHQAGACRCTGCRQFGHKWVQKTRKRMRKTNRFLQMKEKKYKFIFLTRKMCKIRMQGYSMCLINFCSLYNCAWMCNCIVVYLKKWSHF